MDKFLDNIILWTFKGKPFDQEKMDIVRYGLELYLLKTLFLVASFVIAIIMHEICSYFVFIIFFIPLRKLAGGYHANTRLQCFVQSTITVALICLINKVVSDEIITSSYLCGLLTVISILIIFIVSPVQNTNKPLKNEQIMYFRGKIKKFLLIHLIIIVLLMILRLYSLVLPIQLSIILTAILDIAGLLKNKKSSVDLGIK